VPGTSAYHDIQAMEDAKPVGEHFIFRFDADLWFANSSKSVRAGDIQGAGV
jgi:hypothetical protein